MGEAKMLATIARLQKELDGATADLSKARGDLAECVDEVVYCEQQINEQAKSIAISAAVSQDVVVAGRNALDSLRLRLLDTHTVEGLGTLRSVARQSSAEFEAQVTGAQARLEDAGCDVRLLAATTKEMSEEYITDWSTGEIEDHPEKVIRYLRAQLLQQADDMEARAARMQTDHEQALGALALQLRGDGAESVDAQLQAAKSQLGTAEQALEREVRKRLALEAQLQLMRRGGPATDLMAKASAAVSDSQAVLAQEVALRETLEAQLNTAQARLRVHEGGTPPPGADSSEGWKAAVAAANDNSARLQDENRRLHADLEAARGTIGELTEKLKAAVSAAPALEDAEPSQGRRRSSSMSKAVSSPSSRSRTVPTSPRSRPPTTPQRSSLAREVQELRGQVVKRSDENSELRHRVSSLEEDLGAATRRANVLSEQLSQAETRRATAESDVGRLRSELESVTATLEDLQRQPIASTPISVQVMSPMVAPRPPPTPSTAPSSSALVLTSPTIATTPSLDMHVSRMEGRLAAAMADNTALQEGLARARAEKNALSRRLAEEQRARATAAAEAAAGNAGVSDLTDTVSRLETEVSAAKGAADTATAELGVTQESLKRADAESRRADGLIAELTQEKQALEQALSAMTVDASGLRDAVDTLSARVAASEKAAARAKEEVDAAEARVLDMQQTVQASRQQLEDVRRDMDTVTSGSNVLRRECDALRTKNQALQADMADVESTRTQLLSVQQELATATAALGTRDAQLEAAQEDLEGVRQDRDGAARRYEAVVSEVAAQKAAAHKATEDVRLELEQVQRHLEDSRAERDAAVEARTASEKALAAITEAKDALSAQFQDVQRARDDMERKLRRAEADKERVTGMQEELQVQLKLARDSMDTAQQARNDALRQIEAMQDDGQDTSQQLAAAMDGVKELKMKLSAMEQRWSAAEKSATVAHAEASRAQGRVLEMASKEAGLRAELSAARDAHDKLAASVDERDATHAVALQEARDALAQSQAATKSVCTRVDELRGEVRQVSTEKDTMESQLDSSRKELQAFKEASAEERGHQEQRFVHAQAAADARVMELEATAATAELQVHRLQEECRAQAAKIADLQQALEAMTDVADKWAAQAKAFGDRLEAATLRSDAISNTAMAAGDHMQALQARLADGEAREQALRFEIAELKGEVAAGKAELERRRMEEETVLKAAKDNAADAQRRLQLQVSDEQHQVTMLRQTQLALQAELDTLRTDMVAAKEAQAAAEQAARVAAERGKDGHMTQVALVTRTAKHAQQLGALTSELHTSNATREALSRELDEAYTVIASLEHRLKDARGLHPELDDVHTPSAQSRLALPPTPSTSTPRA